VSKNMRTIATIALLPPLLFATAAAHAHAFLDHAEPRVGSSVSSPPRQLSLWFTQNLEPAFSGARVVDSAGARVDQGARVDGGNRSLLRVSLKPLRPGSYKVYWRVLSVDTHTTEGSFSFSVGGQ
jgi:methionine-rich copper-binding protein CopC